MGKPMVKSEFIREFCDLFPQSDETLSTDVADAILDHIVNKLVDGGRIEIRGFGSLGVKYREPTLGATRRTGRASTWVAGTSPSSGQART